MQAVQKVNLCLGVDIDIQKRFQDKALMTLRVRRRSVIARPIVAVNGKPLLICRRRLPRPMDTFNGAHPLIASMGPIALIGSSHKQTLIVSSHQGDTLSRLQAVTLQAVACHVMHNVMLGVHMKH